MGHLRIETRQEEWLAIMTKPFCAYLESRSTKHIDMKYQILNASVSSEKTLSRDVSL